MTTKEDPDAPVTLAVLALTIFTASMLRYYQSDSTPWGITLLIGVSWFLGFAGVLLLPFDIADVQTYGTSMYWVGDAWSVIYWTTFILAWAVIPILSGYLDSGYFTFKDRLKDALHEQIRWGLVATGGLVGFIIYLLSQHYTLAKIEGFLIALGNTYGLMIIVVLLGNGLVEVPRRLYLYSDPNQELQRLYFRSSRIDSDLHDAVYTLDDTEVDVARLKDRLRTEGVPPGESPSLIEDAMSIIQETKDSFQHRPDGMAPSMIPRGREGAEREALTLARLAALHARLKTAQLRVHAQKLQWDAVVRDVEIMEQVVAGTLPLPHVLEGDATAQPCSRLTAALYNLAETIAWHWRVSWSIPFLRGLSCVCGALSLACLWAEILLSSPIPLSPFGAMLGLVGESSPFVVELVTFLPLLYLSLCTYRSLFKFRLFGDFCLKGPRMTLTRPLLVNAQFLVRLQFPLAYHFTLLLRSPASRTTAFHSLMSDMAVVPILGTQFNTFAPLFIMVLAIFTLFHGYARLLNIVGLQHEDCLTGQDQQEMIAEGRALARRRRTSRSLSATPQSPMPNVGLSKVALGPATAGHYRQLR